MGKLFTKSLLDTGVKGFCVEQQRKQMGHHYLKYVVKCLVYASLEDGVDDDLLRM